MRAIIPFTLSLALALAPALRAAEEAPASEAKTAEASAPELPEGAVSGEPVEAPPEKVEGKGDVEAPKEEPVVKHDPVKVDHVKPARFKFTNLLLGAFGGAILGGTIGFFGFTQAANGGIDWDKVHSVVPIAVGAGLVGGGIVGYSLGATSAPDPTPPVESYRQAGPIVATAGPNLVFTFQF